MAATDVLNINELRQERAGLIVSMRGILDTAAAEKRAMSPEERTEYEKIETDVETLGTRVKDEEAQRDLEIGLDALEPRVDPRETQGKGESTDAAEVRAQKYAGAFDRYLRCEKSDLSVEDRTILAEHRADQIKGTTTLGGFTVPTSFDRRLREHQVQAGAMRQTRADILKTGTGEDIQVPKTTAHGSAAWIAEGNAITPDSETFGQITLKSYVGAEIIRVSIQLLQDTGVDLEGYLAKSLGGNIGRLQNTAYLTGNGTGKPTGITTLSTQGVAAAAAAAIATDELMDLFYSVIPEYRRDGEWMMADLTIKAVRKLKLTTGEYIWAPGLVANEPDTLLGKRVFDDPDMPALASGNKSVLFGDLSAYTIRDTGSFVLRRLEERYAENLLVGFLAWTRTDGNLIDQTGAVKHLVQA
jgi:HK97 family phage major capsid protein